ncbi:MAG: hypothetical protein RLZZ262_1183 [Bacteroidota bacterium]
MTIVALEHLYFLYFEMFAWTTIGKKTFRSMPEHLFEPTRAMAANQGLYNGFLAAGLIWAMFISDELWQMRIASFFLGCVVVAGLYGGITVSRKIFVAQALPALITWAILLMM